MNILIVEDEDLAVKKLIKTLNLVDESAIVCGVTDSIQSTVEWLHHNPEPDLVLMDIELADGQSFEIFNLVNLKAPVVFTTSYDEYALRAFKVNSIDYLLKPVQREELNAALDKFKKWKEKFSSGKEQHSFDMENLVKELRQKLQPREYRKRYLVKVGQKLVSVEVDDIAYFFSDGRLNFFKTRENKKYVVDYTMDELEDMLDPSKYFRISRSVIVSINSVEKIDDYFGNRLILSLKPSLDKEATVSREKVADFKRWMGK